MQTKNTTRRAILAGIATVSALAAPGLALSGPDPIFAAIERHRADADAYMSILDEQAALERSIPTTEGRPGSGMTTMHQVMIRAGQIICGATTRRMISSRKRGNSSLMRRRASPGWLR
jgi:hypothetical protein